MSDPNPPIVYLGDQAFQMPDEVALLPLLNFVSYPTIVSPLAVAQAPSVRLIDDALHDGRTVALVTLRGQQRPERVAAADCYQIATVAIVYLLVRLPDGTLRIAVQGVERVRVEQISQHKPYLRARISALPDAPNDPLEVAPLMAALQGLASQMQQVLSPPGEELRDQIAGETDPRRLSYLVASTLLFRSSTAERQSVLELPSLAGRLTRLNAILARELRVLQSGQAQ